jgi:DNA-binding NtrC family response regulator
MKSKAEPRIFIVEDNLVYQQLIAKELEALAGEIYFYTKGENCLEDLHKKPSIIILDYNLEGEINGLDTLQEIRKFSDSVLIILFSSQKSINTRENLNRYGAFTFLEKRFQSFGKLRQMIFSNYLSAS